MELEEKPTDLQHCLVPKAVVYKTRWSVQAKIGCTVCTEYKTKNKLTTIWSVPNYPHAPLTLNNYSVKIHPPDIILFVNILNNC